MPHFRCQSLSGQGKHHGLPSHTSRSGQTWARCLQAGSAANLHRMRHALPKHLRKHQQSFVLFASSSSAHAATRPPTNSGHTESEVLDCVIVGAGISGLTLAQAFASEHASSVSKVLITEAQDRVGGNITSKKSEDGFLYETGPNSFQPGDPVLKLAVSRLQLLQVPHSPLYCPEHMLQKAAWFQSQAYCASILCLFRWMLVL